MIKLSWISFEVAIAIFEIIVYFDFHKSFLERKNNQQLYRMVAILLCICNSVASVLFTTPIILLFVFFAMNSTIVALLFEGAFLHKLFSVVLVVALGLLSEVLSGLLISILGVVDITTILDLNVYRITGIGVSKLVFFAIVKIVERFRKAKSGEINTRNWMMLMLIPLISILVIHQIAFSMTPTRATLPLISIGGILYINILVFALFEGLMRQAQREVHYRLMEQQLESQANTYKILNNNRNEVQKIWHDLKNHLLCLSSMAVKGNLSGIRDYISGMNELVEETVNTIDTGNQAIDAVLNEKKKLAEKEAITTDFEIMIKPNVNMDPIDACILLGNSLDNAIEACIKVEDKAREIKVKLVQKDDHLLLTVTNTANGVYHYEGNSYKSTKPDQKTHGYGLLNIQTIVSKYGGNLILDHESQHFILNAILRERR